MLRRLTIFRLLTVIGLTGLLLSSVVPRTPTRSAAPIEPFYQPAGPHLTARLDIPDSHRGLRPAIASLSYGNDGDADMPAPLFSISVDPATTVRALCDEWRPGIVQVLGVGSEAPAGILPAQATGRIPLFFTGLGFDLAFQLETNEASNDPVDWNTQKDLLRPSWLTTVEWDATWPAVQARLGNTWSDYLQVLGDNAERLRRRNQPNYCVRELVGLEVKQVLDRPTAAIAGTIIDAQTQLPLQDATLVAYRDDGQIIRHQNTDLLSGQFTLDELPAGRYRLYVEGYYFDPPVDVEIIADQDVAGLQLTALPVPEPEDIPSQPPQEIPDQRPALATDGQDRVHLVWQRGDQLWHAVSNNGVFTATQPISGALGVAPALTFGPQLIQGNLPGLAVVWQEGFGNDAHLRYALGRLAAGGSISWTHPITLTTDAYGDIAPRVVITGSVTPLVLWLQRDWDQEDDLDLYSTEISPTRLAALTWLPPNQLATLARYGPVWPLAESCVSVLISKGDSLPNWVPVIGGKYSFEVNGEGCAEPECELSMSGSLGVDVEFTDRVSGSGSASLGASWKTDQEKCEYVFKSASVSVNAGASGSLPLWSPAVGIPGITVEIGGNLSGQASGSLEWAAANFPGWPSGGNVDLTASAGPYGTVNFFDIVEATLSGSGSVTGRYSPPASFQFAGWCLSVQAEASAWIITYSWSKSWGPCPGILLVSPLMLADRRPDQSLLLTSAGTIDDVPVMENLIVAVAPLTGTGSIYEGTPVLSDTIASDLTHDGKAAVARSSSGEILAAWTKDSPDPNQAVGSSVLVANYQGSGWSAPLEVQPADHFNRDTALAFDSNDAALLLWASAPATVTLSSPVTDVVEAIANSDILFAHRITDTWTAPAPVATLPGEDYGVQLAADASGQAVAAWINRDTLTHTLVTAFWNGTGWSAPITIPVSDTLSSLDLAYAGADPWLVWAQGSDGNPATVNDLTLHYATWDGLAWSTPITISKPLSQTQDNLAQPAGIASAPLPPQPIRIPFDRAPQVETNLATWVEAGMIAPPAAAGAADLHQEASAADDKALRGFPPFEPPEECCKTPTPTPTGMPTPTPTPGEEPTATPTEPGPSPTPTAVPTIPTVPRQKRLATATPTPPLSAFVSPSEAQEKIGPLSTAGQPAVRTQDRVWYAIYFENLAAAGRAAREVVIVDPLDADLDWDSFRFEGVRLGDQVLPPEDAAGGPFHVRAAVADLRPEVREHWWVDIVGELDPLTGLLRWTLRTLDPATGEPPEDPLAGFLPPNDASGRGEGHVAFSIRPRRDRPRCASLSNQAAITFDYTSPIFTNPVVNATAPRYDFVDPSGTGVEDIQTIAGRWSLTSGDPGWNSDFDLDSDGAITVLDIIMVAEEWGEVCP